MRVLCCSETHVFRLGVRLNGGLWLSDKGVLLNTHRHTRIYAHIPIYIYRATYTHPAFEIPTVCKPTTRCHKQSHCAVDVGSFRAFVP